MRHVHDFECRYLNRDFGFISTEIGNSSGIPNTGVMTPKSPDCRASERAGREEKALLILLPPSPILPLSSSLFQLIVYRKFIPARMKIALCSTEGEKSQGPQWGCCYNCSPCDPRWCRVPDKTMLAAMQIIQKLSSSLRWEIQYQSQVEWATKCHIQHVTIPKLFMPFNGRWTETSLNFYSPVVGARECQQDRSPKRKNLCRTTYSVFARLEVS